MTRGIGTPRYTERHDVCQTDTQYVVQLSGYVWAIEQVDPEGKRILDIASGAGFGANLLSERARLVVGADLAREPLVEARGRYRRAALTFLQMEATALAFRDASFDLVVSQDTIEHIGGDQQFVAGVARVLKPGGVFIVFTPWQAEHTDKPANPFHLREYSATSLRALLAPYFPEIRFWGRRWGNALARTEAELDHVRRLDPGGLRRVIPRALRHRLASLWLSLRRRKTLDQISPGDVQYVEGAPGGSNTLIAVCHAGT